MALVPSVALLLAGVILAGYLIVDAIHVRALASEVDEATPEGRAFFAAVHEERGRSLTEIAQPSTDNAALDQARQGLDRASDRLFKDEFPQLAEDAPGTVRASIARNRANLNELDEIRERVDSGDISLEEAYSFYNELMDEFTYGLTALAKDFDDAEVAYLRLEAMPLFDAADGMARAHALAAAALSSGGFDAEQYRIFSGEVGAYHARLESAEQSMSTNVRAQYNGLRNSEAWQRLVDVENAILAGSGPPVSSEQWRGAATEVGESLRDMYISQASRVTDMSLERSKDTLVTSIVVGVLAVLFAVVVFVAALRTSNRLVRRLSRLRAQTLDLAERRLPEIVGGIRGGKRVDTDTDELRIDQGSDEIGQVGEAFNQAQQTAVAAAVEEARTREGTKTVFLNIAHRSQVIVHRQLKALDQAERKQEDPDQLDLLFQLDHLSTRARRNAENLIIMGGEQPGRQWRNPVAVADLVRGAIAETEDYARVTVGKLPDAAVLGQAVGDLVHLLAELVDNATAFSPPESRVEIKGNVVGRRVVLEVEDQGLGIEQAQRDEFNAMLANPPEFSVMTLSEEPRLGLFVVARLAARHGVTITLRESAYGGTRAIVLIKTELIHTGSEPRATEEGHVPGDAAPAGGAPAAASGQQTAQQPGRDSADQQDYGDRPALPVRRAPSRAGPSVPTDATVPDMPASGNGSSPNGNAHNGSASVERGHRWPEAEQTQRHENGRHTAPQPPAAPQRPPASRGEQPGPQQAGDPHTQQGQGGLSPGRPALPQRRRQQHIAPQLRESGPSQDETEPAPVENEQAAADTAKHRLSAFQRGTMQAREEET